MTQKLRTKLVLNFKAGLEEVVKRGAQVANLSPPSTI